MVFGQLIGRICWLRRRLFIQQENRFRELQLSFGWPDENYIEHSARRSDSDRIVVTAERDNHIGILADIQWSHDRPSYCQMTRIFIRQHKVYETRKQHCLFSSFEIEALLISGLFKIYDRVSAYFRCVTEKAERGMLLQITWLSRANVIEEHKTKSTERQNKECTTTRCTWMRTAGGFFR